MIAIMVMINWCCNLNICVKVNSCSGIYKTLIHSCHKYNLNKNYTIRLCIILYYLKQTEQKGSGLSSLMGNLDEK